LGAVARCNPLFLRKPCLERFERKRMKKFEEAWARRRGEEKAKVTA
jgi:ribosomal protein L32E